MAIRLMCVYITCLLLLPSDEENTKTTKTDCRSTVHFTVCKFSDKVMWEYWEYIVVIV